MPHGSAWKVLIPVCTNYQIGRTGHEVPSEFQMLAVNATFRIKRCRISLRAFGQWRKMSHKHHIC